MTESGSAICFVGSEYCYSLYIHTVLCIVLLHLHLHLFLSSFGFLGVTWPAVFVLAVT